MQSLGCIFRYLKRLRTACVWLMVGSQVFAIELSDEQIKASYVYNFAKFAEWPSTVLAEDADINLCTLGSGLVVTAIDSLAGKSTGKHRLQIQHIASDLNHLNNCHLLFISQSEQPRFQVALHALKMAPVLTVSDIENFAEQGGVLGLLVQDNKVKFEVNLDTLRESKIYIPGQLLNIANHVFGQ